METMERPKRGAPPRPEVVARDRLVLRFLKETGPQTRNALAEGLGIEKRLTWLALDRLRRRNLVRKCAGEGAETLWSAGTEPCP